MPRQAPAAGPSLGEWLRTPRPEAGPGVWRYGHRPRPPEDPDRLDDRQLLGGAALALLCALLVWSLNYNGYIPPLMWPLDWFTPDSWKGASGDVEAFATAAYVYYALVAALLAWVFGKIGRWGEVWRRHVRPALGGSRNGAGPDAAPAPAPPGGPADPALWPQLRAVGEHAAADRLTAEIHGGRMNDVDYVRIDRAWQSVRARHDRLPAFTGTVLDRGAAAFTHPSGDRDLPARAARHDLLTGQVRLGAAPDEERNPYAYRGVSLALEPALLSTSLLVVGPSAAGKTSRVVRPVVESLALQALAGRAAVVAVGTAGAGLGSDDAYDVVVRLGDPASAHDLDLYGGTDDPDEAAAVLAEALVGDVPGGPAGPGGAGGFGGEADTRRAATALAQLIGPHRAAHGRFPSVPELRELLDGVPVALAALRQACEAAGDGAALRELDARERQAGRPGDVGPLLADRIALLDRPAFAGFFGTGGGARPFAMRHLEHPLRVRVDLPERGHAEASRLLARLLLAQFTACARDRDERSLFACLVLDDAAHTLTPASVRAVQRLRTANAGVVLALRSLDEVPEPLRAAAVGAVGCRVVLSGVSTWDGEVFAQAWGRDWVKTEDVTHNPDFSGGLLRRALRGVRTLFTGVRATTRSVTVRTVQRERWSASDLAHKVPPGHAVVSLTTVRGEASPPVLTRLGE
ncbi:ATP-binding protein [Streptomyces sp. DH37]|uniref:ATP-binding protein n=1 Tax=Streptomyces sp. DH37 TaxID=3040122 RepID=UPI0024423AC3|nr:ATP-binding protein [Streptomyces sp. DH37]MDG9705469.1 ATP-binding protein [Streptomyces sp. DH37]